MTRVRAIAISLRSTELGEYARIVVVTGCAMALVLAGALRF